MNIVSSVKSFLDIIRRYLTAPLLRYYKVTISLLTLTLVFSLLKRKWCEHYRWFWAIINKRF